MVNITGTAINAAADKVPFMVAIKDTVLPMFYLRFLEIIGTPFDTPDIGWVLIPLLLTILMMELYFGHYSEEELGWNTAVGNSLVLIFVSVDLLRHLYGNMHFLTADLSSLPFFAKTIIALVIAGLALFMLFSDFFHILPKKVAFAVSATLPVNLLAVFSIILVYGNLPLDAYTILICIVLYVLLLLLFLGIQKSIPKAKKPAEAFVRKRYFYNDEGLTEMSYDTKRSEKQDKD